ncbi:MAG: nitroreductase family protein [Planctomycetia bacterium]|nr:nitroreductase family protein [Planctomycetia bacterium]
MKDFLELAKDRYSVRAYSEKPIPQEVLDKIIEAGMVAPTATNNQPQRIYVLKSPEALQKIRALTRCAFNAPVVLLIALNKDEQWNNPLENSYFSGQQDVSIVATHMMLAAWDLGVGSCWVNYFPNSETARAFNLPSQEEPILLLPLGYPADNSHPSPRHSASKSVEEIVRTL